MSKTTVIDVQNYDQIEVDKMRDEEGDIYIYFMQSDGVFLNRKQTKKFIEVLQSTLEDEETNT